MQTGSVVAERFELVSVAGSGGMGVVYRARDRQTGREVALKSLRREGQEPTERFAQEVELLSGIHHPHIVGYVTHGIAENGTPYLVMPWLDGADLQARLAEGPLSVDETIALARGVANGLAHLHERGLVHRDLKPSNLFLPGGRVEEVRIMDLGITRATAPARLVTMSGVLVGTPAYIAPEQARGDREIAPAVDMFALGCVLFECLTGRRLFQGQHVMAVLAKVLVEEAPRIRDLRPDVPDALDAIVQRMVAKDPSKRPRDGAQLGAWLADFENVPSIRGLSAPALTGKERRVLSVLVVALPSDAGPAPPSGDATWVEGGPFRAAALQFGVRLHILGERTAIALAPEDVGSPDQATTLARLAMQVLEQVPHARVAVATGRAIVGSRVPVGDAIDRAVTMVSSPATGGIHVDAVTAALITSRFDIRRDGDGLVIHDERQSLDPTCALLGKPTSCVGREAELTVLETLFGDCESGGGPKVTLVTAPAGAGKSRLGHELVRRLLERQEAPMVLQARGDALRVSTPYGIVASLVRQAIGVRERQPLERVRQKLANHVSSLFASRDAVRVADFLGELVSASFDDHADVPLRAARGDAAAMEDQVGVAFVDIVRRWSERQPVVLVLDDLQWADLSSIKLLDGALRRLAGAALYVLALARPEVHERLPTLFSHRDMTEIRLPPLSRRASVKLVEEVLGTELRRDDADRIAKRADGNAFYLEELIRAVAERALRSSSPPPPPGREQLPDTVIAVAQARLDRLEPEVRKVLRAASIFGDVFWLEGVASLVGDDLAALGPVVAALVEHEVIARSDAPRLANVHEYAFRHTLVREAAYATLTEDDRVLGHALAANWLHETGEEPEVVALHWLDGGDPSKAGECFAHAATERWNRAQAAAAARCALRALLLGDASVQSPASIGSRVRLLATALKATRHLDEREALVGLERHLRVEVATDSARLVRMALDRAVAAMRDAAAPAELTYVLADGGRALAAISAFADANEFVRRAFEAAGDDERLQRYTRWAAARVAFWEGEYGIAWETLSQTVLPEDGRERLETLLMLATAVVSVHGREALDRGLDFVSRAEALLSPQRDGEPPDSLLDDPVARVHCVKARAACLYFTGEYAAAVEPMEETALLARNAGLRFDECSHLHNLAELCIRNGDRVRARTFLERSDWITRDMGSTRVEQHNAILFAYLDGRQDELVRVAEEARGTNKPWGELHARYWLGRLLVDQGACDDARATLERAVSLAQALEIRTLADECTQLLGALPASQVSPRAEPLV